jgi:hypothetical protein
LAPYAAGINAGSYASLMSGDIARLTIASTSVRETASRTETRIAPVLKTKLDLVGANKCPNATVLPMTENKATRKSSVDSNTTGGTTAGHLGTSFAWYLLSPEWSSIWPLASQPTAYNNGTATKVGVLTTDGLYNTVGGKMSGANEVKSADFAVETCTEIKAKGIIVYTVCFKFNALLAKQTLRDCASHVEKFHEAKDGDALRLAFRAIAQDFATLRLSEKGQRTYTLHAASENGRSSGLPFSLWPRCLARPACGFHGRSVNQGARAGATGLAQASIPGGGAASPCDCSSDCFSASPS